MKDINICIAVTFVEMNDINDDDECNTETNSNNRVTIIVKQYLRTIVVLLLKMCELKNLLIYCIN